MAVVKFSAVAGAGAIAGANTVLGVQGGTTDVQYTFTSLKAFVLASPTVTGHITVEGVTSTGATGTGKLVFDGTPTLVTPILGVATATSINKLTLTAPASGATFTLVDGKTLTVSNTLTLTATDGSTLAIGAGGTLGSNAYTSTAYAPSASPTFTGTVITAALTVGSGSVFKVGNAATTGLTAGVLAALTNATIVISDSTGQAYRIPCII